MYVLANLLCMPDISLFAVTNVRAIDERTAQANEAVKLSSTLGADVADESTTFVIENLYETILQLNLERRRPLSARGRVRHLTSCQLRIKTVIQKRQMRLCMMLSQR
jgi:hypothetical protein